MINNNNASANAFIPRRYSVVEIVLVAAVYILTARTSQYFGLEPSNVTPVWLPSGIMVAWVFVRGAQIWPGVFLGAALGNAWAYFSLSSFSAAFIGGVAAFSNGLGDVLSTVGSVLLLRHLIGQAYPFKAIKEFGLFIVIVVILGSAVSAVFGVSGLLIADVISSQQYLHLLTTWFIGDCIGALVIAPLLLSWLQANRSIQNKGVFALLIAYFALTALVYFQFFIIPQWLFYGLVFLFPAMMFMTILTGQRTCFTGLFIVATIALIGTWLNRGPFVGPENPQSLIMLQCFIGLLSISVYFISIISFQRSEQLAQLAEQKKALERLNQTDHLTGVSNRLRLNQFIDKELSRIRRGGNAFGLIMIDIDDFKAINDHYGHLTGDKILVELTALIGRHIREADVFGRWGGEEFMIVLPDVDNEALMQTAEKLRGLVAEHSFHQQITITISLGVTSSTTADCLESVIERADASLYKAKSQNKNCVVVEHPSV